MGERSDWETEVGLGRRGRKYFVHVREQARVLVQHVLFEGGEGLRGCSGGGEEEGVCSRHFDRFIDEDLRLSTFVPGSS